MWKLLEHQEVEDNFYFSSSMDDTGGNEKLNYITDAQIEIEEVGNTLEKCCFSLHVFELVCVCCRCTWSARS